MLGIDKTNMETQQGQHSENQEVLLAQDHFDFRDDFIEMKEGVCAAQYKGEKMCCIYNIIFKNK